MINGQYICSILLAFCVSMSEQENQNELSLVRGRYNFNHPPSFENYNPLLVAEESEGKVLSIRTLKNDVTTTRSLKDKIPEDESIVDDLLRKSEGNILGEEKKVDNVERESRSRQAPVTIISESDKSQGSNILERASTKATNKAESPRRRIVQKLESKRNKTNVLVNERLREYDTTESVTKKTIPVTSIDEDKVKIVSTVERSSRKGPKRSRERKPVIPIIENENFVYSHTGDFHYSYESGDGTKAFERGELKTFEDKTAGEAVVGSFSYIDKDGNDFSLSYTADENGYRPKGAHLPTPPPIPPAIARALLYLSTKTTPQPVTESYL